MKSDYNQLFDVLNKQKELISQYEKTIKELELDKIIEENNQLSNKLQKLQDEYDVLKDDANELRKDNNSYKSSLRDMMLNDKLSIIDDREKKLSQYVSKNVNETINDLHKSEELLIRRVLALKSELKKFKYKDIEDISNQLDSIEKSINTKLLEKREIINEKNSSIMDKINSESKKLKDSPLNEDIIEKKRKNIAIETKLGLNALNIIGAVLILLAFVTLGRYSIKFMSDITKTVGMYSLSGLILALGVWLGKRGKRQFSLGLIGVGIGGFYISTMVGYFMLDTLSITIALVLSVVITLLSIAISHLYKSIEISILSLLGGYLPMYSYYFLIGVSEFDVYVLMGYVIILNLLMLTLTFKHSWKLMIYISYLLLLPWIFILTSEVSSIIVNYIYMLAIYMVYTFVTIIYSVIKKKEINPLDILVIVLNATINLLFMIFYLFENGMLQYILIGTNLVLYTGVYFYLRNNKRFANYNIYFYIPAVIYLLFIVGYFIPYVAMNNEHNLSVILISFTSIGIMYSGFKAKDDIIRITGYVYFFISYYLFVLHYVLHYNYLMYVLVTATVLVAFYIISKIRREINRYKDMYLVFYQIIRIGAFLHLWHFIYKNVDILFNLDFMNEVNYSSIVYLALLVISNAYLYITYKTKLWNNIFLPQIGYIIVIFATLLFNLSDLVLSGSNIMYITIITLLVLHNIILLLSSKELIMSIIDRFKLSIEVVPIYIAIYLISSSTTLVLNSFDMAYVNSIINSIYLLISFSLVYFGLKKGFVISRRLGLGLTYITLLKFFVLDLAYLGTFSKIISYFILGVLILLISYLYQYIKNTID